MDKVKKITSGHNPKIKQMLHLRKRRERNTSQLFLIEGYRELKRAFESKVIFESFFYSPEHFLGKNEKELVDKISLKNENVFCVSKDVFSKISYRDRPDGLIAIAQQEHYLISDIDRYIPIKRPAFILIVERIEKPGNLGTILRSCDAAGVDVVIVCDALTDIYNPNVVRASIGTLFTVPIIEATSVETKKMLEKLSINTLITTPYAKVEFTQVDMQKPIAVVVGSEQYGVSDLWLKSCKNQVKIPMHGNADSLNVATATTLVLYEVVRQRSATF